MKEKIIIIFFFLIILILFYSLNIFQIDNIDKIPVTGYFINPNQYLAFFNQTNTKIFSIEEIEKKIEENQQLIANLLLTGVSFIHKRSMKSKGFESETEFKKDFIDYKLEPYSIFQESGFYISKTSLITITEYIRKRVKRVTGANGILVSGEGSLSFFDKILGLDKITEDVLFEAVKNCILNAAIKAFGNNYIFEINGYFHLVEEPQYRFNSSLIYVRIKGYIIFYSFTR